MSHYIPYHERHLTCSKILHGIVCDISELIIREREIGEKYYMVLYLRSLSWLLDREIGQSITWYCIWDPWVDHQNERLVKSITWYCMCDPWVDHQNEIGQEYYIILYVRSLKDWSGVLYQCGPVIRAIWSFMDQRQQYWPRLCLGQHCCQRSIKPTLTAS